MAMLDLDVFPMFAALVSDGSVLLELALGDDEHLVKVTMPPTKESRSLAGETTVTLDLDDLPSVAPVLARDITEFVAEIRHRLVLSAITG